MIIETRDFGKMDICEQGILEFKLPILGFENQKQFVILYDDEMGDSFAWLQSVTDKNTCFIIIDPAIVFEDYRPELPADILKKLEVSSNDAALRCLMVVPNDISAATVNLKSPLIINPTKKLAAQVVLDADYPIRACVSAFEGG